MSTVTLEAKNGTYIRFENVTNVSRGDVNTEITCIDESGKRDLHIIENGALFRFSYYDIKSSVKA